jgi:tetratricopeptide (TPR) repeat protein
VDGDLNSITMKALEKARARRYASVADLAADIQNHLEHRPVLASPRGKVYLASKFLRRHRLPALGTAAGVIILSLSSVTAWSLWHRESATSPKLTAKDVIVLADFDNRTGDPVFDDTLRQALSVELQQSPVLSLISDTQVLQVLGLMGQPRDARLTPELAQQICERTASAATLEGSIATLGSRYVVGLRARTCTTGTILDQEQIQAARREDVLNSLSQIAREFRTRVGESLATVERYSMPLSESTTPSLEALKAYTIGLKLTMSAGNAVAIPSFRRAVEIDPNFATAYAHLGLAYSTEGESVLAAESTTKAWRLRERVSDRERFFIDFNYDRHVTGNLEKAYQTLELWQQTYPRGQQPNPESLLGGITTHGTARYERAIDASQKSIAADPDFALAYASLAGTYFLIDRFAEAEKTLYAASERKLEVPRMLLIRYIIAVLKGDQEQMDRTAALAKGKRKAEHWMAHEQALALARSGRLQAARRSSNRAVDLALQEGEREAAAGYQAARAVWDALSGNAADGKRNAIGALDLSKGRDVEYAAALALGLSGDVSRGEDLAGDLEKRFPEDTFVKFTYVPVLRGLAALRKDKPAESVEHLQIALPYELAANGLNFTSYYLGGLHSGYVRGESLLAARRYAEAAAEFQKILDHPGIVGADPIGVLTHLQLGRVYAMSGDTTKAKAAYEAFLALWKDADADVPILKRAKAEYARL